MSQYDSSMNDEGDNPKTMPQFSPFHYDYYLSNSLDVFDQWKIAMTKCQEIHKDNWNMAYLQLEFPSVCQIQKFRTADIIRSNAFVHILKTAFEQVSQQFHKLFDPKAYQIDKETAIQSRAKEGKRLQKKLNQLLFYLQIVSDHCMQAYYENLDSRFQRSVFDVISKLYLYVTDVKLLWDISESQPLVSNGISNHSISLGGNHSYYKNILRSMLKRHWRLKEVYDRLLPELRNQTLQNFQNSHFLIKMICQVLSLETAQRLTQKQKADFIDIMKGLYFLSINLRRKNIYYDYILTSFHLKVLAPHRMFKNYQELELLYINILQKCKKDASLMNLVVYTIQMDMLFFQKREKIPEIQQEIMNITYNYIGVAKHLLDEHKIFLNVAPIPYNLCYASSKDLLEHQNIKGLVELLMSIQQNSKDAFFQGDINVHKIYLEMSEVIKEISLSYQYQNWLFPSNILIYIPLRYFIDMSEDIKADVKKTLFTMVEAINQDQMPFKLKFSDGKIIKQKVQRGQYLQVILYFLLECHHQEQYINLPQVIPTNMQTSILYIKSLELKLNQKQPTPDQMPYVVNMLKTCQNYKLTINFKWYQPQQSIEDRQIQFNIQKGLPQDWMRKIYRQTINQRQSQQIRNHFDKYKNNKGLNILSLANIFKYCHGLNPGHQIDKKNIKQDDLFILLDQIKMLLSIQFDIFHLNFDQEISLNYIHVCLSLYNSCYDQTPFNEAYMMIMEKIMKPYLREPNSSLSTFKNNYPGFFQKWIYSFQINLIFQELGTYISQKGEDDTCREDIINKIKIVKELINNKENIIKIIKIQDLTETIILFSTLISRQAHPLVYIQSVQLFCQFLNTFPEVKKQVSLDFMLDTDVLSDHQMASEMIAHIKSDKQQKKNEVSILNSMIKNLIEFMNNIGLKKTNELMQLYAKQHLEDYIQTLGHFEDNLFHLPPQKCTFLTNIIRYILTLKNQHQNEKNKQEIDITSKMTIIQNSINQLQTKNLIQIQEGLHFSQLIFIEDIINQIDKKHDSNNRLGNLIARQIFHNLIKKYGSNEDIIYFAQKLDLFDLILLAKDNQFDPKQQALLIDLLIETKHKGKETQLIKKILRQNKKLSDISGRVIDLLSKQKDKIHSRHINKFIHINNRYPKQKIQQFLLENIGCERNHAAVKIKQQYLIKDLIKKLQKIPKNICQQLLLKPIKNQQRQKLIDFISDIFEKLLYLPITKFQNVITLRTVQETDQFHQDWNTQSQGEPEEQIRPKKMQQKQKETKSQKGSSKFQYKSNQSDVDDHIEKQQHIQQPRESQSQGQRQDQQYLDQCGSQSLHDDQDYDRPPFLQIFTQQSRIKEFQLYSQFMVVREQLDVLIDSKYHDLKPQSPYLQDKDVIDKILKLSDMLNQMDTTFCSEIITRMPLQLYKTLKTYGLTPYITNQMHAQTEKRRKIVKKPPKWMLQLFSDREESDDSGIDNNNDEESYSEQSYSNNNLSDSQGGFHLSKVKNDKSSKKQKKMNQEYEDLDQIPVLLPTYSKIQQQISGEELKRQEIIKILQISLYWFLHLPQSQIKTSQITSFYMDILQTNLGQIFFQSFMTLIRFDQTPKNLQSFLKTLKQQANSKIQIGLQQISMQNAINNILYLIKQYQDRNENKQLTGNILFKESSILLPIAQTVITKFNLPIQNNCLTLLFIYISTNKAKIRDKIKELDYTIIGNQLIQNKKYYKLKGSQMERIIEKVCKHGCNHTIWQTIQSTMNLKVRNISKLFGGIRGYGRHLYTKLTETGQKILKTIKNAQKQFGLHHEHQKVRNLQHTYHVISKLVLSVKEDIKQFYFINKENLKQIIQAQNDNIYEQIQSIQHMPAQLLHNKNKIFKNQQLILLVQTMIYFIKILKDHFYGKIQDKMFHKLIHYPKMIIEAAWYYIFIFHKHHTYKWHTPSQIQQFFQKHPFIGSHHFTNLQEVFDLIIYFFNLESFCIDKFKQFFLPILMKNPPLSQEITLMFKMPKIGQDQDYMNHNILVTRKCSFDMAYYQVTGQSIQVQFHGEEGSDHGGLVRELMIGWKGRGVGQQAFFIGKILGISFKQGVPYGGTLDIGMFIAITNYNITIQFFQQVDPQIYRSLTYIKHNDPQPLSLKFTVQHNFNGKLVEYQLIEGGKDIDLVQANKEKYLSVYLKKYFYVGRQKQLSELKLGFNTVVYPQYAQIFTPFEMLKQIRGEQVVDVKMLISKAKYQGYSAESAVIRWFWTIVQAFNQEAMNTFIQFVTGSPKITVYNSNFSITIEKVYDIDCLPVAHTCFNTIDLPQYPTKQILEKKLLTAIFEGNNSFGIL